jgi:hypothetical protein
MNARLYDPVLGRMLSPDNFVGDAGTQGFNRYSYANNNPLNRIDPDGNEPITIIGALILIGKSAVIGAATSATINGVTNLANGNNFFKNFGQAAAYGAISGAIGGGFSLVGQSLGAIGNSIGYSMFTNAATNVGTSLAMDNRITLGSVLGSVIGGGLDGAFAQFKGLSHIGTYGLGDALKNIVSDLAISTARGALIGSISGGFGAAIDGTDIRAGILSGARTGAISAFTRSFIVNSLMGSTIRPNGDAEGALNRMENILGINFLKGPGAPIYRTGGLFRLIPNLGGITIGRSMMVRTATNGDAAVRLWVHESYHYYQQQFQTWAGQLGNGIIEQWIKTPFIRGYDPYETYGTNEFGARSFENYFMATNK